jgi:hypothetical protein
MRTWRTLSGVSQLRRVRRIYDRDPAAYHRGSLLTERLLAARRRKVGEIVTGRLLDIGFGTGLSLPPLPAFGERDRDRCQPWHASVRST